MTRKTVKIVGKMRRTSQLLQKLQLLARLSHFQMSRKSEIILKFGFF